MNALDQWEKESLYFPPEKLSYSFLKIKKMKTIDEALDYLYSFINYETDLSYSYTALNYNLERTLKLLELLHHPEERIQIIHVAGTKGKGSTCTILDSLLRIQNYPTGLFTSPHVGNVNERIRVNAQCIRDDEIVEITNRLSTLVTLFPSENLPTTFELFTAIGMLYFHLKSVRYAILETGLGGRLDSTNFCTPILSVITSISFDHMEKLGTHIEDIAREKAGIIKRDKPVVVGYQPYNIVGILIDKAKAQGSTYYLTEKLCRYEISHVSPMGTRFNAIIDGHSYKNLFLSLAGRHQVENAVTALLSLKVLNLLPDDGKVKDALAEIHLPTRLELIQVGKRCLLDSAHNGDSARALTEAMKEIYKYDRLITILGVVKGKDIHGIVEHISSVSNTLIVTEPLTYKKLDTEYVYRVARSFLPETLLIKNIYEAVKYALETSTKNDLILITGSFYTTSPARDYVLGLDKATISSGKHKTGRPV